MQIWFVIPYLILVSTLYWLWSRSILKSSHGVLILLAFVYAVVICEYTEINPPQSVSIPMYILLAAGLVSMLFSFTAFKNKGWVHIIHVFSFLSAFFVLAIGSMAIDHQWI